MILHSWNVSPFQAEKIQEKLRERIILCSHRKEFYIVGGGDVAYSEEHGLAWAAFVVMDLSHNRVLATSDACVAISFPYIPGLLAFREAPPLLAAWQGLAEKPQVVLLDGHGIVHPRGTGLAAHFGLWIDCPTIGCAKTPFHLKYSMPGNRRGSVRFITVSRKKVGAVVRTRTNVKPVFVSPGHRIDLSTSVRIVLTSSTGYRIPEPLRQAHLLANSLKRKTVSALPSPATRTTNATVSHGRK